MANEADITQKLGNQGDPISYKCSDGVGIPKGTILWLDNSAGVQQVSGVAVAGDSVPIAGIAAEEKVAGDGKTQISVLTNCIADLKCTSTAVKIPKVGELVVLSGQNLIMEAVATDVISGCILGKALEPGASADTILVRVGPL